MVETDLRDDANRRIADIRRIKPSAQSAFENRIVDLRLSAKLKRNRRQRLEKGNLPSPISRLTSYLLSYAFQRVVVDRSAVEEEAFIEFDEMRRCVSANPHPPIPDP